VKVGRTTDTLLSELTSQEETLKALERRIRELDGRQAIPIDGVPMAGRVASVAAEFRARLKAGGPNARRLLQHVLNGLAGWLPDSARFPASFIADL